MAKRVSYHEQCLLISKEHINVGRIAGGRHQHLAECRAFEFCAPPKRPARRTWRSIENESRASINICICSDGSHSASIVSPLIRRIKCQPASNATGSERGAPSVSAVLASRSVFIGMRNRGRHYAEASVGVSYEMTVTAAKKYFGDIAKIYLFITVGIIGP